MTPFSVLDLCPIIRGGDATQALANTLDLAQHAERWGYRRYWLAEHHNMVGIASAATSVVIGHVAAGTSTIRVGAGGVMLPNHAPLVIAEQFGTLAALFPGRIDLGVGRAPGTDPLTSRALRRDQTNADSFPQDVVELESYFREATPDQKIRAVPGAGLKVPIWILGSSMFGAQLAAMLGLPYAFASHFAPDDLMGAIEHYRNHFQPSDALAKPYVMLGVGVFAAETDREAEKLFTSLQQAFVNLRRGKMGPLEAPIESMDGIWSALEKEQLSRAFACSFVGSKESVREGLRVFIERTKPDEIIATSQIYDHTARLRSFEMLAEIRDSL